MRGDGSQGELTDGVFRRSAISSSNALMGAALLAATIVMICVLHSQSRSLGDGIFTQEQAARGETLYKDQCANCHGDMLEGSSGPPLAGDTFIANWKGSNLGDIFYIIKQNMPKDSGGTLTPRQSADLLAFMLNSNGFPAGSAALESDRDALSQILMQAPNRP